MINYTKLPLMQVLDIKALVTVHYFEYGKNYFFEGESHDFWEFLYVDKGELDVCADDVQHHLTKGQMIFHRPGEFHNVQANGLVAPNLVVISFVCNSPAMSFFEGKVVQISSDERAIMANIIQESAKAFSTPIDDPTTVCMHRCMEPVFGAEQLIKQSLSNLLIQLIRKGELESTQNNSMIRQSAQQGMVDNIISYLQSHIAEQITLEKVCKDNLVGRSTLQKAFRERTGGGVMEYFGQMKIKQARHMIREGGGNVTEIAISLGFSSIHYFSRYFKKVTGMTPTEYASSVKGLTK